MKEIERDFGIRREEAIEDIDGYGATVLWSRHLRGERSALQRLVAYNREDVVHLKAIMEMSYDRLARGIAGDFGDVTNVYGGVSALPKVPRMRK